MRRGGAVSGSADRRRRRLAPCLRLQLEERHKAASTVRPASSCHAQSAAELTARSQTLANRYMRLPNGDRADLGLKLEEYALNPRHRDGRHKAYVFESVLGMTLADPSPLRQAILAAAATSDAVRRVATTDMATSTSCVFRCRRRKERDYPDGVDHPPWRGRSTDDDLLYSLDHERSTADACNRGPARRYAHHALRERRAPAPAPWRHRHGRHA